MATVQAPQSAKDHPVVVTAVLSLVGYALVIGTFLGAIPASVYPDLSLAQVNLLADTIAVVNSTAAVSLAVGWYWIRRGDVTKHRTAMLAAFGLILVFLVLYLLKVGGGGTKEFVGPTGPYYAYLLMLAIHIILSIVSVPLVVFQVVTGLTKSTDELYATAHPRVGRVAAAAWILSLSLGVLAYLLLNHVYDWRFVEATVIVAI